MKFLKLCIPANDLSVLDKIPPERAERVAVVLCGGIGIITFQEAQKKHSRVLLVFEGRTFINEGEVVPGDIVVKSLISHLKKTFRLIPSHVSSQHLFLLP